MNNWFYRRKAFAMSAFQAVDPLCPPAGRGLAMAIAAWGWQPTAKVWASSCSCDPALSVFIQDSLRVGLTMDGDPPGGAPAPPRSPRPGASDGRHPLAAPKNTAWPDVHSWAFWN